MPSEPGTLNFPTSLDDVISLIQANNHASAALSSGINNSVLLIPVTQPSEFSDSGYATILDVVPNPTVIEIIKYTSKSGSDLVVPTGGRGQQNTSASAFSAGAIVEQRGTQRHWGVLRDAIIEIEKKIGYSAVFRPLDPVGTNQAGANLDLTGGAGTGNAVPGLLAARYPLVGASGTTLQSLSASRYPLSTNMFAQASGGTLNNSVTETSLFTIVAAAAGATRQVEGGSARAGTHYRLTAYGTIGSTGTPTFRIRGKYGATTIADTTAAALANNTAGSFRLTVEFQFAAVGATGAVAIFIFFDYGATTTGAVTPLRIEAGASQGSIDTTTNKDLDVTFQFGTANSLNTITIFGSYIERIR